jgi:hypothetical protein
MSPPTWTMRCAAELADALADLACEAAAVSIDGGLGIAAVAAISALPPGPLRDLEIATWARRCIEAGRRSGVRYTAILISPDASDSEIDAAAELAVRIRREAGGES